MYEMRRSKEGLDNPLSRGFLESKKGLDAFEEYLGNPTREHLDKLDDAFKSHYMIVKCLSYFSKSLEYEAKHYDKRRRRREHRYSLILDAPLSGDEKMTMKDAMPGTVHDPSDIKGESWEDDIADRDMLSALRHLTDRQQEVIQYSFFYELKDKDIAARMGITPQAVSKTRRTALKKLRKELEHWPN